MIDLSLLFFFIVFTIQVTDIPILIGLWIIALIP